jgi:proline dehydrogenase
VLRRVLLAASDSGRMRQFVTSAPLARGVVARYVAGDEAADAVAVAGRLRDDGLLITLDHLGEDTRDARHADLATQEYTALLASLAGAGLAGGGAAEVSVKPTAVGLGLADHGEKTATENISRIAVAAR